MTTRPMAELPQMSDYGVSRETWRPLPWEWAAKRLTPLRNYWLTTAGPDGQPHSLPVWGVWDDSDLRFAFGCSPDSRKARNIAANPRVTLTTENTIECVSVQGVAATVTDPARTDAWVPRFVAKYGDEVGPEYDEFLRSHPLFEVTPTLAFAVIERADEFATRATRWRF